MSHDRTSFECQRVCGVPVRVGCGAVQPGVKKPYNPILGEVFQCQYDWGDAGKTLYVAEQVSHHPPVSAFYSTNRKGGWQVSRML